MTVRELYNVIDSFCPKSLSCSWDNDGIMVSGDLDREVYKVLLTLDATIDALEYACDNGYDVIITHHPMLFRGMKSVNETSVSGRRVLRAILSGITVLSFHTRLDACEGGVNDVLMSRLGFEVNGYFGDEESPRLGRTAEISPMTAEQLALHVKERLGCDAVRLNGKTDKVVSTVGVCGGDGKDFIYPALAAGCDAIITGDAGYNMAADAQEDGIITVEAGHYHTEAPVLTALEKLVRENSDARIGYFDSCTYKII